MKLTLCILSLPFLLLSCKSSSTGPLTEGQSITAKERNAALTSYVDSYHAGLRLLSLSADSVDMHGKAPKWECCFVDTSNVAHRLYYFHVTSIDISFDSTTPPLIGPSVITGAWFDSDSAMTFAQSYGGSAYITKYPGTKISASLGQAIVPNASVTWGIYYLGTGGLLGFTIDAKTGALLGQTK